jgi:hypothetical protein
MLVPASTAPEVKHLTTFPETVSQLCLLLAVESQEEETPPLPGFDFSPEEFLLFHPLWGGVQNTTLWLSLNIRGRRGGDGFSDWVKMSRDSLVKIQFSLQFDAGTGRTEALEFPWELSAHRAARHRCQSRRELLALESFEMVELHGARGFYAGHPKKRLSLGFWGEVFRAAGIYASRDAGPEGRHYAFGSAELRHAALPRAGHGV